MRENDDDKQDEGENGLSLWRYVTRTVKPLTGQEVPQEKKSPPVAGRPPVKRTGPVAAPPNAMLQRKKQDFEYPYGLDKRSDDRLRRGQMEIEARLDLHGMNVVQARDALERFLLSAHQRGLRCVLVITGKGRREGGDDSWFFPRPGILKQSLGEWLAGQALRPIVLRHYPAKGKHGGAGAFYILLRRIRD